MGTGHFPERSAHGLPRTNADKRKAVKLLLADLLLVLAGFSRDSR